MTIKIYSDRIDIGDFTLFEGNGGVQFDGVARAENFSGNQGFQGSVAGYTVSSQYIASPPTGGTVNVYTKYSFVNDGNSVGAASYRIVSEARSHQSSSSHGYSCGGYQFLPAVGGGNVVNAIEKFPFSSDVTTTSDVGDLTTTFRGSTGQSSTTNGYSSGTNPGNAPEGGRNFINKFPFSSDTNATDIGNLTVGRNYAGGQSSTEYAYTSAGGAYPGGTNSNTIDKFPFSTDTNATDVGDVTAVKQQPASQSSTTSGYVSGGFSPGPTFLNVVERFPFSTDTNATDISDLTQARYSFLGTSSTTHGYSAGGVIPPATGTNTIDKFPFSTDSNASDVGDLNATNYQSHAGSGAQV